ncbi:MAG: pyridoxamine 5'-phosphate oxidase family protein [Candidatus Saccharibacteria bacterium]
MTDEQKTERLKTVCANLDRVMIASIATVNSDGTPHNSPVFIAFTNDFSAVWSSAADAQHSHNIIRDHSATVSITLFDSIQARGGGLYIAAQASQLKTTDPAFAQAYRAFTDRKAKFGGTTIAPEAYATPDGQQLYIAKPTTFWINYSQKDNTNAVIHDTRVEVTLAEIKEAYENAAQ